MVQFTIQIFYFQSLYSLTHFFVPSKQYFWVRQHLWLSSWPILQRIWFLLTTYFSNISDTGLNINGTSNVNLQESYLFLCHKVHTGVHRVTSLSGIGFTWHNVGASAKPQSQYCPTDRLTLLVLLLPCYIQDIRECWDIEENMWRLLPLLSLALALPVIPSDKSSVSSPSDNIRSFQMENLSFSRSYS